MPRTIVVGPSERSYRVIEKPVPHILVDSRKEIHGWWAGPRECTSERLLINPYNGCTHDCPFCYAHAFRGFFGQFLGRGIVAVWPSLDRAVAAQLDSIDVAHCGYLSPATDPFQPLERTYRVSERIIAEFVRRNIPIEFITKGMITRGIVALVSSQRHSFGQISILTPRERLNRKLSPGGASVRRLLSNIEMLASAGVFAVARIDPVVPFVTDREKDLKCLVDLVTDAGARHLVVSCLDVPFRLKRRIEDWLTVVDARLASRTMRLFAERKGPYLHADLEYRRWLFSGLRSLCEARGLTFALCMEFDLSDPAAPRGLNAEFMTSRSCEGLDVPIYMRVSAERFEPFDCDGACLSCKEARCGIPELAKASSGWQERQYTIADYHKWTRGRACSERRSHHWSGTAHPAGCRLVVC